MLHFISFLFIFLSWVLMLLSIKSIFNPFIPLALIYVTQSCQYWSWKVQLIYLNLLCHCDQFESFCAVVSLSLKPPPRHPTAQHLRTKWTMASGKIHTRPFLISITVTAWIIWTQEIWTSVWIPVIFIFYDRLAPLFSVNCVCAIYLKLLFKAIHK